LSREKPGGGLAGRRNEQGRGHEALHLRKYMRRSPDPGAGNRRGAPKGRRSGGAGAILFDKIRLFSKKAT
jgi:hypothetical protein